MNGRRDPKGETIGAKNVLEVRRESNRVASLKLELEGVMINVVRG